LVDGFPIPSTIITDKKNKVRYASFHDSIVRSVKESLRVVAAIKMLDDAKGTVLAPADWVQGKPTIRNTKAGVKKYYKELYTEETKFGVFSFPGKIFRSFYDRLFGSSLPVEKMIAYTSLEKDTDTIKTETKDLKSTEDIIDKVNLVATALNNTDINDYCPSDEEIMCDCSIKFYHSKNIHELSNLKKSN